MVEIVGSAVVALLAPYFVKAAESVAEEVGKASLGKVQAIYQAIVQWFRQDKDDFGQKALQRLAEKPTDKKRQKALSDLLDEKVADDPTFGQELAALLENATEGQPVNQFVNQIFGPVGKNVTIGTVNGDLSV